MDALEHPDHSPWTEYHVASEYYRLKQYDVALLLINTSIVRFIEQRLLPPSLLYALNYAIFIEMEQFEKAVVGAIQLYPDYVDLHYYKGVIQYHYEAIGSFDHCLTLGDEPSTSPSIKGTGSFKATEWKIKCTQK